MYLKYVFEIENSIFYFLFKYLWKNVMYFVFKIVFLVFSKYIKYFFPVNLFIRLLACIN